MKESTKKSTKKRNNKGFSLVEMIVVMAIMAILIGALAPQLVKYVEQARERKDLQVLDNIFTSVQTAIASSEEKISTFTVNNINNDTDANYKLISAEVVDLSGIKDNDAIKAKLKSKEAKKLDETGGSKLVIHYDETTESLSVSITDGAATPKTLIGPVTN